MNSVSHSRPKLVAPDFDDMPIGEATRTGVSCSHHQVTLDGARGSSFHFEAH